MELRELAAGRPLQLSTFQTSLTSRTDVTKRHTLEDLGFPATTPAPRYGEVINEWPHIGIIVPEIHAYETYKHVHRPERVKINNAKFIN